MKKDGKIILWLASGFIALKWWQNNQQSLSGFPPMETENIGKIYDSYTVRSGSRVDRYWMDMKIYVRYLGRKEDLRKHFLDPQTAVEHFNLHGIEFGNWMNQEERANFLFATMVSFADMAKAMNIAQNKIGLKQKLQMSFGARGSGGHAAAFYARKPYALINLTKPHGRGTLAHEYGHALDEHLHLKAYNRGGMASGEGKSRQTDPDSFPKDSMEYLFERVFHILYRKENGEPTSFYEVQEERPGYFQRRREVWARTFDMYMEIRFEDLGIRNSWAINGDPMRPPKRLVRKAIPFIQRLIKRAFA